MNRRKFLIQGVVTASAPAWGALAALRPTSASKAFPGAATVTDEDTLWRTFDHLQQHLLPTGNNLPPTMMQSIASIKTNSSAKQSASPGARDINALNYLNGVFADPKMDPANKQLIIDGARNLQQFTLDATGQPFHSLDSRQKEEVLRELEKTPDGRRFLGKMMEYLVEALLGSPVYGGNTNEMGWKWLNHNPGFPLPPANKRYFLL